MATKIGLGVSMPLLAPATAIWAAPFAAYYVFLQNRIVYHRLKSSTYMGDSSDKTQGVKDPLYVATRAQLNFAENVPLALAIALLAELNGANRHVEAGLMKDSKGAGRIVGYYGTQTACCACWIHGVFGEGISADCCLSMASIKHTPRNTTKCKRPERTFVESEQGSP
ncbi:hypothetical protein EJ07DRAFT_153385 [Lizonia empirigonia]|nr:hypothetical protein EJ07DRAFT_153385 [Lizonia empirigonia]